MQNNNLKKKKKFIPRKKVNKHKLESRLVKLINYIQESGISLENFPLPEGIKAHYCKVNGRTIINLDPKLYGEEEFWTLVYELGRHFTDCATITIPQTEGERMQYEKEKAKASQWAAENFIVDKLKEQLKQRLTENPPPSFEELLEEFDIPPRILVFAIHNLIMNGEFVPEEFQTDEGIEQGFQNLKEWDIKTQKTFKLILINAGLRLIRETLNRNIKPKECTND